MPLAGGSSFKAGFPRAQFYYLMSTVPGDRNHHCLWVLHLLPTPRRGVIHGVQTTWHVPEGVSAQLPGWFSRESEESSNASDARRLAAVDPSRPPMPCTRPLRAYKDASGRVGFGSPGRHSDSPLALPCGQCQDCRLQKAADWATRITHEAQLHERNSFITLTYADDQIPDDQGLSKRDVQLFLKRARYELGPLRYYLVGEYGPNTDRPHYHACLFGHDFHEDREVCGRNFQGDTEWRSDWLDWIWRKGGCRIGNLTEQSAGYVARYCMKKATGPLATVKYKRSSDGRTWYVEPERAFMSLKPGIGSEWLKKYHRDVYPIDEVVINGSRRRPPRYYDKSFADHCEEAMLEIKAKRQERAAKRSDDLTPERLLVREHCTEARLRRLHRSDQ